MKDAYEQFLEDEICYYSEQLELMRRQLDYELIWTYRAKLCALKNALDNYQRTKGLNMI